MTQTRKILTAWKNITIGEYNLEHLDNFIYLGVQLTQDENEVHEIKC